MNYQNIKKKRYNEDDSNIDENYILENKNKDFNELSDDDDDEEKKNYSYDIKNLKISLGPRKKKKLSNFSNIKNEKIGFLVKTKNIRN